MMRVVNAPHPDDTMGGFPEPPFFCPARGAKKIEHGLIPAGYLRTLILELPEPPLVVPPDLKGERAGATGGVQMRSLMLTAILLTGAVSLAACEETPPPTPVAVAEANAPGGACGSYGYVCINNAGFLNREAGDTVPGQSFGGWGLYH